jgi:type II secretory pathway component HofQ
MQYNSDVDKLLDQAVKEARAGRREAARKLLLNALKSAPDSARAARLLARLNEADDDTVELELEGSPRRLLLLVLILLITLLLLALPSLLLVSTTG